MSSKLKNYIATEQKRLDEQFALLEQLAALRKEKQLSQRQLAEMICMSQPMLAKIEKNEHSPQLNTLLKILDSLGFTIAFVPKKDDIE